MKLKQKKNGYVTFDGNYEVDIVVELEKSDNLSDSEILRIFNEDTELEWSQDEIDGGFLVQLGASIISLIDGEGRKFTKEEFRQLQMLVNK